MFETVFGTAPQELFQLRRRLLNGAMVITGNSSLRTIACLGRELARMEIRIVLQHFLTRTKNLRITGPTPYIASMFAPTLVQLPIQFGVTPFQVV